MNYINNETIKNGQRRFDLASTRRIIAIVLMGLMLLFVFADDVFAKTKYKKYYVPTEINRTSSSNGDAFRRYKYFKSGLPKSLVEWDDYYETEKKEIYKRNKYGFVKDAKGIRNDKLEFETVVKFKKGKPKKDIFYSVWEDGSKTVNDYTKYYYKKGAFYKCITYGGDYTTTYYYNKKGMLTKVVDEQNDKTGDWNKTVLKYKYKFNKRGLVTKITENETWTEVVNGEQKVTKNKSVTKNKYSYDRNKCAKKCVRTTAVTENGTTKTNTAVYTYKYKKVKVAKKYWRLFDKTSYSALSNCIHSKNIYECEF